MIQSMDHFRVFRVWSYAPSLSREAAERQGHPQPSFYADGIKLAKRRRSAHYYRLDLLLV